MYIFGHTPTLSSMSIAIIPRSSFASKTFSKAKIRKQPNNQR